jgi:hypothetical protein
VLARFVRKGIAAGRFRPVDPLLAARGFLGMVIYHSWIQELYGGKKVQEFDPRVVSRTLAGIWLAGMHPKKKKRTGRPKLLFRKLVKKHRVE